MKENQLDDTCYGEGRRACEQGDSIDSCPYPSDTGASDQRWSWMKGYLEYKMERFWDNWMDHQTLGDLSKLKRILN